MYSNSVVGDFVEQKETSKDNCVWKNPAVVKIRIEEIVSVSNGEEIGKISSPSPSLPFN